MDLGGAAVLEQQVGLNGGAGTSRAAASPARPRLADAIGGALDGDVDATPRLLAAVLLGSVATLFLLRVAGFRFSFGVGVGGGG